MYLSITIPALFFNLVTVPYALYDIIKHFKYSKYYPRLLLISLMISGPFLGSLLTVIPTISPWDLLSIKPICAVYSALNYTWLLKTTAFMFYGVFVSLIILSKYPKRKINKIGMVMFKLCILIYILWVAIVLPLTGVKAVRKTKTIWKDKKAFQFCTNEKSSFSTKFLFWWPVLCCGLTFLLSICLVVYNYGFEERKATGNRNRLILTFLFYSIATNLNMIGTWLETIFKIKLSPTTDNIVKDFGRFSSGVFALTYLLSETLTRQKKTNFSIGKAMPIEKIRKLFKRYLEDIKDKKAYDLLLKWELVNKSPDREFEVAGSGQLDKKKAILLIEKMLEIDFCGFLLTDDWGEFYDKYMNAGTLDAQFMIRE